MQYVIKEVVFIPLSIPHITLSHHTILISPKSIPEDLPLGFYRLSATEQKNRSLVTVITSLTGEALRPSIILTNNYIQGIFTGQKLVEISLFKTPHNLYEIIIKLHSIQNFILVSKTLYHSISSKSTILSNIPSQFLLAVTAAFNKFTQDGLLFYR